MPFKNIVHGIAKNVAERTAPDYVPPPKVLTLADKHKLIRAKAKLELGAQKLSQLADFLRTTHQVISAYQLPNLELTDISPALKNIRNELLQQITLLDARLK